jgi:hypothetical protein
MEPVQLGREDGRKKNEGGRTMRTGRNPIEKGAKKTKTGCSLTSLSLRRIHSGDFRNGRVTIVNNCFMYLKFAKRVDLKYSYHRKSN